MSSSAFITCDTCDVLMTQVIGYRHPVNFFEPSWPQVDLWGCDACRILETREYIPVREYVSNREMFRERCGKCNFGMRYIDISVGPFYWNFRQEGQRDASFNTGSCPKCGGRLSARPVNESEFDW